MHGSFGIKAIHVWSFRPENDGVVSQARRPRKNWLRTAALRAAVRQRSTLADRQITRLRSYVAFFDCPAFHFAHRARCAAAILRRAAADRVRLGFGPRIFPARFRPTSFLSTAIALSRR